jgi:hypothetical protein
MQIIIGVLSDNNLSLIIMKYKIAEKKFSIIGN